MADTTHILYRCIKLVTACGILVASCTQPRTSETEIRKTYSASDRKATAQTQVLNSFLQSIRQEGVLIGHQDDLIYGNTWYNEEGWSDVKRVCGEYPAMAGYDIGGIETGSEVNIDSVPFSLIKQKIREAYQRNMIPTIIWHATNPVSRGPYSDLSGKGIVDNILPKDQFSAEFARYLDRLGQFLGELKNEQGDDIPIIFRPYMSHNRPDRWWSSQQCTPDEFKKLWIQTVNYLRNIKNIHHLLYAYSVSGPVDPTILSDYYPGNDYVDILGLDLFLYFDQDPQGVRYKKDLETSLNTIGEFASEHGKIPALTCTGLEGIKMANYFTGYLYPGIEGKQLSYILFWRNAWNIEEHYHIPIPGHPASDDFIEFTRKPSVLLLNAVKNIYSNNHVIE